MGLGKINKSRKKNYFGGSLSFGYKSIYNAVGIAAQARLLNHIDLDLGWSYSFFNGNGYSAGINLVPFKSKIRPFIGVEYGKSFGDNNLDVTNTDTEDVSYYRISPVEYVYLKTGIMFEVDDDEFSSAPWFFVLNFSYRKAISDYSIELVGGPVHNKEDRLKSRMENGVGFNISLIVFLGKK